MKTTVDFSVESPYSHALNRSKLRRLIDQASYRHQINFLKKYVTPGDGLLDVGCGSGIFLKVASTSLPNLNFYGLDYDHRLLEEASQRVVNCKFSKGSAEELPFEDNQFQFLTTFHNIEHLFSPEKFVSESARVIADQGYLLLATPNPTSYVAQKMQKKWPASPTQTPDHINLKSPQEWRDMFEASSFKLVYEGTTFFSSLPVVKNTPLQLVNHALLYTLGALDWQYGEAYQAVFQLSRS